ncbi:hypothetical protein CH352_18835 [Leptospira hartskeerlii]|uniref:Uncharacterized protein n=1 Tax=Leptospira hartskeerlii TaxID=2023177 RepID=A0A2M9X8M4_9LEPT|nr:hypothetical protein [Leptospira hartskeerlii]PJZ23902.1 hypothetical protein CH357_18770 [Leptospira hartskeerlii]PJZ31924.1 hypothetical protein CH352_18835 [Leptospira hartskeerlii]
MDLIISIIINITVSVPVSSLLLFYLKSWIGSGFSKKIERFKNDLENLRKQQEFEFKKSLDDYSLYSVKKHEVYRELYVLFSESMGLLFSLSGLMLGPDYNVLSKQDLLDLISDLDIFDYDKKRILNEVANLEKEVIVREILKAEYKISVDRADKKFVQFKNYTIVNEIYCAENLNLIITEVIAEMAKLITAGKIRAYNKSINVIETGIKEEEVKTRLLELKNNFKTIVREGLLTPD